MILIAGLRTRVPGVLVTKGRRLTIRCSTLVFALDEKSASSNTEAIDFGRANHAQDPPAPPALGCSNDITPEVNLLLTEAQSRSHIFGPS
jgi:hypothetical protein